MLYNAVTDHDVIFEVPAMATDDEPLYIGLTNLGTKPDPNGYGHREQWAYSVATGPWDADVRYQGDDLRGPANAGPDGYPGAAEMAASLMSFLGAYSDGYLQGSSTETSALFYSGDIVATGEAARFIVDNGERFAVASSDFEAGYLEWTVHPGDNIGMGREVHVTRYTGKEEE